MFSFLGIAFVKCKRSPFTTSMNESLLSKITTNDEEKIIVQSTWKKVKIHYQELSVHTKYTVKQDLFLEGEALHRFKVLCIHMNLAHFTILRFDDCHSLLWKGEQILPPHYEALLCSKVVHSSLYRMFLLLLLADVCVSMH